MTRDQYTLLLVEVASRIHRAELSSARDAVDEAVKIFATAVDSARKEPDSFFDPPPTDQPEVDPLSFDACTEPNPGYPVQNVPGPGDAILP